MSDYALRFICGGALIAALPYAAARFGDTVAGILLLFPIVTIVGLAALGLDRGMTALAAASAGAVVAIPVVAVFLVVVTIAARHGMALAATLTVGVVAWVAAAGALIAVRGATS